ncbi:MAG TPA: lipopolysaccharide kinase InaA family protein [Bacillota bacterium]|nr:lipopolysaccharide kinase InaA family protein [Bacillota bacterium]
MEEFSKIIANNKGVLRKNDVKFFTMIGKGADGSVYQVAPNRCVKVFEKIKTKELEWEAFQAGQLSPVIPKTYKHGKNYIVMEYVKGRSLPQYLKKEKALPETIVKKILQMLDELKKIGFKRLDIEVRHILFNENMDIKVIDLKRSFTSDRPTPNKLLAGLKKRGYLKEFMKHVKKLNPSLYKKWKSIKL